MWKGYIRGLNVTFPGCGETSTLFRGKLSPRVVSIRPSRSSISRWAWGFHIMRGGIDAGDSCIRPLVVGVADLGKDFWFGDGKISSLVVARPRLGPDEQLSTRAVSMSPRQSAINRWRSGSHTVPGGVDPGITVFAPGVLEL